MDATELLQYIYDENKIEYILENLGLHSINSRLTKEFRCGLPNHNNKTSVSVNKQIPFKTKIFLPDEETVRGDLFTLTMYLKKLSFPKSIKYLHEVLGLKYTIYKKDSKDDVKKENPLDIFNKVKPKKRYVVDVNDLEIGNEELIKDYTPNLHVSWIKEGIISKTARRFNIGYDWDSKRIIIPHRWWCGDENEYIGIIGRTTLPSAYCDMFDIPKYYPIKKYPKSINLYGLNENYKSIQEAGYVVLYEAEKSTLKRHSRLDETGTSLGSHDISDEQVKILISLDVDIVIALDEGIREEHVWSICEKFYGIRKVSFIYDKYGLLDKKESPADKPDKIFKYLFKHRVTYDESYHKKYVDYINNTKK